MEMTTLWLVEVTEHWVAINPWENRNCEAAREMERLRALIGNRMLHSHLILSDKSPEKKHFEGIECLCDEKCCQKHYECHMHPM